MRHCVIRIFAAKRAVNAGKTCAFSRHSAQLNMIMPACHWQRDQCRRAAAFDGVVHVRRWLVCSFCGSRVNFGKSKNMPQSSVLRERSAKRAWQLKFCLCLNQGNAIMDYYVHGGIIVKKTKNPKYGEQKR